MYICSLTTSTHHLDDLLHLGPNLACNIAFELISLTLVYRGWIIKYVHVTPLSIQALASRIISPPPAFLASTSLNGLDSHILRTSHLQ
jgi:hypothetical protein